MGPNLSTTVEFFAGIGGFRVAADSVGFKTEWANDIDSQAALIYRQRFGSEIHEGDVHDFLHLIPKHDVLSGGFPCQPFSSAGKKQGTRDPRGTLFQVLVQSIGCHRPKFFVLENVKRLLAMEKGCHFATILSALTALGYRVEWRLLNATHFGLAQNRQRVIIIGSRTDVPTGSSFLAPTADFSTIADPVLDRIHDLNHWWQIEKHGEHFATWGIAFEDRFISTDLELFSVAAPRVTLEGILQRDVPSQFDFTATMESRLNENEEVNRFVDGVQIISNQQGGARMGYTVFGVQGLAPTLTAATSRHYERYKVGNSYRRLTNIEYARLQGFPDDHCSSVPIYDQYRLFGNAVPPPMIRWVFQRIQAGHTPIPQPQASQLTFA